MKTNWISHLQLWFSHQGCIANKEDYCNSGDQDKEIGNELCILVGINPKLSQFLNFWVDFLLKHTMFDYLHWWSIFFSIRICSIQYKYQSLSTCFRYKAWTGTHLYCAVLPSWKPQREDFLWRGSYDINRFCHDSAHWAQTSLG